jgi:hypothetical protein
LITDIRANTATGQYGRQRDRQRRRLRPGAAQLAGPEHGRHHRRGSLEAGALGRPNAQCDARRVRGDHATGQALVQEILRERRRSQLSYDQVRSFKYLFTRARA